jgi:putative endonuclease
MWPWGRKADRSASTPGRGRALGKVPGRVSASVLGKVLEKDLGPRGEALAAKFLTRQGLKILARNFRCPAGEADLIALDSSTARTAGAETIVFVEVKTRSSDRYSSPESAVNDAKRRKMRKVADSYLAARRTEGFNVRFDIVSIVIRDDGKPQIKHLVDAI